MKVTYVCWDGTCLQTVLCSGLIREQTGDERFILRRPVVPLDDEKCTYQDLVQDLKLAPGAKREGAVNGRRPANTTATSSNGFGAFSGDR